MTTKTLRKILDGRPLHRISPERSLREVAEVMAKHAVGAVAVIAGEELVGILTERDIVFRGIARRLAAEGTTAAEVVHVQRAAPWPQNGKRRFPALDRRSAGQAPLGSLSRLSPQTL